MVLSNKLINDIKVTIALIQNKIVLPTDAPIQVEKMKFISILIIDHYDHKGNYCSLQNLDERVYGNVVLLMQYPFDI